VRHITPQLCAQLSCISLLLIFVSTSSGQIPIAPSRVRQRIPSRQRTMGDFRTDVNLTERDFEREKQILLLTLRNDFRQLQLVNNELMKRTFVPPSNNAEAITRDEILASLSEIQSHARRLKMNFRLPEVIVDKNAQEGGSHGTLSSGLLILDQTVTRFVENPIFQQQLLVLDAELSVRAAQDLNKILRLTDNLRRRAKQNQKN
jgi:hypothetical protein